MKSSLGMQNCPFCKEPIESYWTYCRNCNKPLITNIDDELANRLFSPYDANLDASSDSGKEDEYYDVNVGYSSSN